jgi:hypothetical protein
MTTLSRLLTQTLGFLTALLLTSCVNIYDGALQPAEPVLATVDGRSAAAAHVHIPTGQARHVQPAGVFHMNRPANTDSVLPPELTLQARKTPYKRFVASGLTTPPARLVTKPPPERAPLSATKAQAEELERCATWNGGPYPKGERNKAWAAMVARCNNGATW